MSCLVAATHVYYIFSLSFARGDYRVTRSAQDAHKDANDLQDSGLSLRAYVRVCAFSSETTEQLLKLDDRLEPIDGATFIF